MAVTDEALRVSGPAGELVCAEPPSAGSVRRRSVTTTGLVVADEPAVVLGRSSGLTSMPATCR